MTARRLALVLAGVLAVAGCSGDVDAPAPAAPATSTAAAAPAPARVEISRIGVDSTLTRTGMLDDPATPQVERIPEVPPVTDPGQASWATWSPEPGLPGPATLYGHVDGVVDGRRGVPGVFARLGELRAGDEVLVDRLDNTTVRFSVYDVRTYPKADLPEDQVYGDTPAPELRLVTCGGSFDQAARSYRDQVVAYARIAP